MTRHRCVLNDSNGFVCDVCETRRERAVTEFDRDYLPKLRALLKDMRLSEVTREHHEENLLDAYLEARMEETNDDS